MGRGGSPNSQTQVEHILGRGLQTEKGVGLIEKKIWEKFPILDNFGKSLFILTKIFRSIQKFCWKIYIQNNFVIYTSHSGKSLLSAFGKRLMFF